MPTTIGKVTALINATKPSIGRSLGSRQFSLALN
jgi:hypothetical protein